MIPQQDWYDEIDPNFEEEIGPTKNYRVVFSRDKIAGFVDELEGMKQAIYLLLTVERYDYSIYSFNAGAEFRRLIGKPTSYVVSEVKRVISECLLQDDRITAVDSFNVKVTGKGVVTVSYVAHTIFGDIPDEREVLF
jgi:hypothetical protein